MGLKEFGRGVQDRDIAASTRFRRPSVLPSQGATELTTGESVSYEDADPYALSSAYGQAETGFTVKDPYKPLVQSRKKPEGVYKG
jgi:hypothetical protein